MILSLARWLSCLLALGLSGCASTYQSPGLGQITDSEVAVLEHADPIHGGIVIQSIDGAWRGVGIKHQYFLTPGTHSIGIAINEAYLVSGEVTRLVDFKPGRHYEIRGLVDRPAKRWDFVVIDKQSGFRVDYARGCSLTMRSEHSACPEPANVEPAPER